MARRSETGSKTRSLLVEFLTEELPPKSLKRLSVVFADSVHDYLKDRGLVDGEGGFEEFATPRRLAVRVRRVRSVQPDQTVSRKGPTVQAGLDSSGKPSQALLGFARSCGVSPEKLERHRDGKAEYFLYRASREGESLARLLPGILNDSLKRLPVAKQMRWSEGDALFVRPVHGLLILHGTKPIKLSQRVLGLAGGSRSTWGHRFLGKGRVEVASADEYERTLERAGSVVASFGERRERIVAALRTKGRGAAPVYDDALIDEITALVEYPTVQEGAFSARFLEVPPECLVLSMQQHQRYIPLKDARGKLLPRFLMVSNLKSGAPTVIVRGNERVLRARLSDAKFFFDQDRKESLENRVQRLERVIYHGKLGSQLQRVARIQLLAAHIARELKTDVTPVERSASLCKADLLTGMVGEFPELQGTMGRYYALHDGEPAVVADAIEAHYLPRFAGDRLPEGPVACALALADKLCALAGLFGIGEQPTGEKDPFGLRRAALGVIRILVERDLALSLSDLVNAAFASYERTVADAHTDLEMFMFERFAGYLRERGFSTREVESVLSLRPVRLHLVPRQLEAVKLFQALPEAASLAAANKRVANILRQAEAKGESYSGVKPGELKEPAERALHEAIRSASAKARALFDRGDYTAYLRTFSVLKAPVDEFFDSVMVMVDDDQLRRSRLALLRDLREAMNRVADLSKLAA